MGPLRERPLCFGRWGTHTGGHKLTWLHTNSHKPVRMVHLSIADFMDKGDRKRQEFRREARNESGNLSERALLKHAGKFWKGKADKHECHELRPKTMRWLCRFLWLLDPALGVTHGPAPSWPCWQQRWHLWTLPDIHWALWSCGRTCHWHSAVLTTSKEKEKEVAGRNIKLKRH